MIRNLIYHVTPMGNYKWNIDNLKLHWKLFTGRKIIAVAQGKGLDLLDTVKKLFEDPSVEFYPVANDTQLRETASFLLLLKKLEKEYDPDSITFYGHTKGVLRWNDLAVSMWTASLYYFNLGRIVEVEKALENYATAGSFCRYEKFLDFPPTCKWHYSGTFFWFNTSALFKREWKKIFPGKFGVEGYLGTIFNSPLREHAVIHGDGSGDMYDIKEVKKQLGVVLFDKISNTYKVPAPRVHFFNEKLIKNDNKLSIIISCHADAPFLPGIINSIEMQRVYRRGRNPVTGAVVDYFSHGPFLWPYELIITSDGPYTGKPENIPSGALLIENKQEGGVGHSTREPAIKNSHGDWIVLTNADNFFMHSWMNSITDHFKPDVGLIYWNVSSNLWKNSTQGGSKLKLGGIDLSAVCVRSGIAKMAGFGWRHYTADWDYINYCLYICKQKKLKVVYIDECLGIHN